VARLNDIVEAVGGEVVVGGNLEAEATGCYVSDLLSDVLANSHSGNLWITHHTHPNVVAVAAVKELAGVVVAGGKPIEPETVTRAETEKVTLVTSKLSSFEAAGAVYTLLKTGVKD
jgi:hypothetical protein